MFSKQQKKKTKKKTLTHILVAARSPVSVVLQNEHITYSWIHRQKEERRRKVVVSRNPMTRKEQK